VPLWLFADMGLENITSDDFLAAVEEGNDVPPMVLREAEKQISDGEAVLLGYNTQAAGPQAEQLKSTAEKSEVPIIDLAETMPAGSGMTSASMSHPVESWRSSAPTAPAGPPCSWCCSGRTACRPGPPRWPGRECLRATRPSATSPSSAKSTRTPRGAAATSCG